MTAVKARSYHAWQLHEWQLVRSSCRRADLPLSPQICLSVSRIKQTGGSCPHRGHTDDRRVSLQPT